MKAQITLLTTTLLLGIVGGTLPASASSTINAVLLAQSPTPVTYMTPQNADAIAVQITEGDFYFYGMLRRSYGSMYSANDGRVRVIYDRSTGRVVVINAVTGVEYYNYFFTEARRPSGGGSQSPTPVTYTTMLNADAMNIQITEGDFYFYGTLNRSSGNIFTGSDGRVRVVYDRSAGRMVVINVATGTEFYNYAYTDV